MSTYTAPATPNLVATLWGPLSEIVTPLLDGPTPAVTDPGIPELLATLGQALTAAVRVTRGPAAPAPLPVRAAAARTPAARVTTAQVGSVAGEPKPGTLRARLIDYLATNPGQAYTATELFHALGATSGGAVGAALNTMTTHGEAIQVSESPKRYTAPEGTSAPVPAARPAETADPHDGADQDDASAETADGETAPAAGANRDTPDPHAHDTQAENAADQAAPQTPDAPTPRTARGLKTKP
jgi:hypothetical protein